jgi:hypothetical protein
MDLNDSWKNACRVLFGGEVGELEGYADYLSRYNAMSLSKRKSEISKKEVVTASSEFCRNGKFISNEEGREYGKVIGECKLDINGIKDVDSILEALEGRIYYAGNIRLGKFREVDESDRCSDSAYVHHSQMVYESSKYIAYSNMVRDCEHCFGTSMIGESTLIVKGHNIWKDARCFEILRVFSSSDCYFSANMEGCSDCMFSFNQRNKKNIIGNLQLTRERYLELRKKLLGEMREKLQKDKSMPGIVDLLSGGGEGKGPTPVYHPGAEGADAPGEVEKAFASTCKVILGRELGKLNKYGEYLSRHVGKVRKVPSMVSRGDVLVPDFPYYLEITGRLLTLKESLEFGKGHLGEAEVEKLGVENALDMLERIRATTPDTELGTNVGMTECADSGLDSAHSYRSFYVFKGKYVAYSYWPRNSEYSFGCASTVLSRFTINCYNSFKVARCFEVEGSYECNDCYFCHNCENLTECMFCFNAKSLRYAIGNREVGKEAYMRIKKLVLGQIATSLMKRGDYGLDIYNLGCWEKGSGERDEG